MDREYGAQDALAYVRRTDFPPRSSPSTRPCSGRRTDNGRRDRLRHDGPRRRRRADRRDRGRDARLRVHGKGALQRLPDLSYMAWPPPLLPRLVAIAGRDEAAVTEAARRYGFERAVTDWRAIVEDPEIGLFDNGGPNDLHAEPTIAAAEAGKHVICEKPLGRDAAESYEIWKRVAADGRRPHVRVQLPLRARRAARPADGRGRRARRDPPLPRPLPPGVGRDERRGVALREDRAGSGALGDLGTHVVDLARYLVGEIDTVAALTATFHPGARSTTRSRRRSASRTARSGRSRRRGSQRAERTRSPGRSTARRARSPSTSSGSTSSRSASATTGSAPASSPRPTIPSGPGGGPMAT